MIKIAIAAISVMFLWAICYPLITLSLPFAPLMLTAFFRAAFAGIVLIMIARVLGRPIPTTGKEWIYITAIGFTATSIGFWGMFYAGSLISPGLATVLTNTQPLMASLLGWYFLKERLNQNAIIGILLGFIGILIVSAESLISYSINFLNGVFYISIATLGLAVSNVLLKQFSSHTDIFYAMGFQLFIGSIPLGLLSFGKNELNSFQWNNYYVLILLTLTLLGTALPFILWFWLMDKAPLYKLNVFSFLTPIFGLSMGVVYFSESLSSLQWVGIITVSAAIFIVAKSSSTSFHNNNSHR